MPFAISPEPTIFALLMASAKAVAPLAAMATSPAAPSPTFSASRRRIMIFFMVVIRV
ncbi:MULTISPECIES: hypothetical protein [unclassified Acidisoma]|uniref:hypothetical protein n=1 Tax=unclassified Acidisoma TaxID=2634065 RepID=UPI00131E7DC1|nr:MULTISPECIES: hypothetical protein [unclassified Acidisoma]